MTETSREQRYAERLVARRAMCPDLPESYWEAEEREQQLRWQVDDLTTGLAELAGKYGFHAAQNPDNTLLAELVGGIKTLVGLSGHGVESGQR